MVMLVFYNFFIILGFLQSIFKEFEFLIGENLENKLDNKNVD